MTTDNIEALNLGIILSDITETYYLAVGDTKNAEKARAFTKFVKSTKEFLEKL